MVALGAHILETSALEVLLLAGGCNGSAGIRLAQVRASVLLSLPFYKRPVQLHDGQRREIEIPFLLTILQDPLGDNHQ